MKELVFKAVNPRTNEVCIVTDLYWFEENGVRKNGDNDWSIYEFTGEFDKNRNRIFVGDTFRDSNGDTGVVQFNTTDVGSCGCCWSQFMGTGYVLLLPNGNFGDLDETGELLNDR